MHLTKRQLAALKQIAPKNSKGGGPPSVMVGTTAEATDRHILLRLQVEDGEEPGLRLSTRALRDAASLTDEDAPCEVFESGGATRVRTQDGSYVNSGVLDHAWPNTKAIKRLRENEIGASVFLDPKLLRKVAAACQRVASKEGLCVVRLDVPLDTKHPVRFSWSGGEAFLMPMSVVGDDLGTPGIVEVPIGSEGAAPEAAAAMSEGVTDVVAEAAKAPGGDAEPPPAPAKPKRRAARAKGGGS